MVITSRGAAARPPRPRFPLRLPVAAMATAAACATLAGASSLAATWLIIRLLGEHDRPPLGAILAAWAAAALLSGAASLVSHVSEARFETRLRRAIARHALRLPPRAVNRYSREQLRRLVSEDVAALHHLVAHLPGEIATLGTIPAAAVCLLVALVGPAGLLALLPGALGALAYLVVIPRVSARHGAEKQQIMADITAAVADYTRGIDVVRSTGTSRLALGRYERAARRFGRSMAAWVSRVAAPAALAVGLLQASATFAIAYAVGAQRTLSELAALLLLSLAVATPALRLGHGLDYVAEGRGAARRIADFLATPARPASPADARAVPPKRAALAATALDAAAEGRRILAGVSLSAPAGSVTTVTGPSGAGKSTLLHVLAGRERPAAGRVTVGGEPVDDLPDGAILHVPQGLDVVPDTVRANLALSAPGAPDAALARALERAQFPADLDASAAELSGGERQRLNLARVFLSDAPVVLLDEPTSALDADTAQAVWRELRAEALAGPRTLIAVTHDPGLASDRGVELSPAGA